MSWDNTLRGRLKRGGVGVLVVLVLVAVIGLIFGWAKLMNWIEDTYGKGWSIAALITSIAIGVFFFAGFVVTEDWD